jgi:hypothetical protein
VTYSAADRLDILALLASADMAVAHSVLVILASDPVTVRSVSNITHHLVKEPAGWRVGRRTVQPLLGTT